MSNGHLCVLTYPILLFPLPHSTAPPPLPPPPFHSPLSKLGPARQVGSATGVLLSPWQPPPTPSLPPAHFSKAQACVALRAGPPAHTHTHTHTRMFAHTHMHTRMCAHTHAHTSYAIQALDGLVFPHSTVSADWRVPAQLLFQCLSRGVHVSQLGVVAATVPRDWPKPMASLPVPSQCSTLSTHLPVASHSVLLAHSKLVHKPQQRPSLEREGKGDSDIRLGQQFIFGHL